MEKQANKELAQWLAGMPWQYFFTGTFHRRISYRSAYERAQRFFELCAQRCCIEKEEGLSYCLFAEGLVPDSGGFLYDEVRYGKQGEKVRPTRGHVHAVLAFDQDPQIEMKIDGYHWMWAIWFNRHGRVALEPIASKSDCVRYCAKYCTKSMYWDTWTLNVTEEFKKCLRLQDKNYAGTL